MQPPEQACGQRGAASQVPQAAAFGDDLDAGAAKDESSLTGLSAPHLGHAEAPSDKVRAR